MKFLSSLIVGMIMSVTLCAAEFNVPRTVAAIIEELNVEVPVGGTFHCNDIPGIPLLYSKAENGSIVQIGVCIFSETVRSNIDPNICDCVERTLLEMLLCKNKDGQKRVLSMKRMGMTVDGFSFGSKLFPSLDTAIDIIREAQGMDFKVQDKTISLSFTGRDETNLRITIPADVTVIFPFDKKEHEEYLLAKLSGCSEDFRPDRLVVPSNFSEERGYQISGRQYYLIDSLSNNVYFREVNGKHEIVYDAQDPVISFRNAAMGAVSEDCFGGVDLDIHFRSYNPQLGNLTISLSHFLGFMKGIGMDFYSGDMSVSGRKCALLVFHHPIYQYIDMLTVDIPDGCGFPSRCVLPAELNAFIPQNNIKSLFGK